MASHPHVEAPSAQPESTKERILTAAEAVFAERGFAGASTREIAGRAGVNISSLHYHWESKEVLYRTTLRAVMERVAARLLEVVPTFREQIADESVRTRGIMDMLFDLFEEQPTVPALLLRRVIDGRDDDREVEREALVPLWGVFSVWVKEHGLDEQEARLFMLTMHSVIFVYLLDTPAYQAVLGGSIQDRTINDAVRKHVGDITHILVNRLRE